MFLKLRRLVALYIDLILIFYACSLMIDLLYIFDNLFYLAFIEALGISLFINLILIKDCIFGYESLGKKVMFLKIYRNNVRVSEKKILRDRVYLSLKSFPTYPFMIVINNKSAGDKAFSTSVR